MSGPVRQAPRGGIRTAVGVLTVRGVPANPGSVETARPSAEARNGGPRQVEGPDRVGRTGDLLRVRRPGDTQGIT